MSKTKEIGYVIYTSMQEYYMERAQEQAERNYLNGEDY